MSKRLPLDDEEGPEVLPLLKQMESILQFDHPLGRWHARRCGGADYGHGQSPTEAMQNALTHPIEAWRK